MTFNINSANAYNRRRNYSSNSIHIIQREAEVGARTTDVFDDEMARQIYNWQQSPTRLRPLIPDGKMGPLSLGTMIAELMHGGRTADATLLSRFPNILPSGVSTPPGTTINPIIEFRAITVTPIGLRGIGAGFMMGGRFKVRVRFNPSVNCVQFEYRQFIKGTATVQQGAFVGSPSIANWHANGALHNAANDFQIPGGLQPHFSEDGQITGGTTNQFGYRTATAVNSPDIEDRYIPVQATGCEYRLTDTYGLRGNSQPKGLRIRMSIMWQGRVIDTSRSNRIVDTRHWRVDKDEIIT